MFIRSSTATNDCLIALDTIQLIYKSDTDIIKELNPHRQILEPKKIFLIFIVHKDKKWQEFVGDFCFRYKSEEDRDKAFDELCAFLNSNYKLRDFT